MPNYRIQLAYDGSEFAGSQVQPGQRTVQGELDRALEAIGSGQTRTTLAGRTDRGVHAVGQVAAACHKSWRGSPEQFQRALGARLPSDLAATSVRLCDPQFHPRFDAKWREYRYRIAFGVVDPFTARYAHVLRHRLDFDTTEIAASRLQGKHDFATFASGGHGVPNVRESIPRQGTTRTVFCCECREVELTTIASVEAATRLFELRVVADGFLPRMVRNIVGALVEIGQGRRRADWIDTLVAGRDRRLGPSAAPAQGLILWRVGYGDDSIEDWY